MDRALTDVSGDLEVAQIDALLAAAGPDGVREIYNAFWRSSGELLDVLANQISAGDCAGAASSAHALKGSAANVGASGVAQSAAQIEDASKGDDVETLRNLLAALNEKYAATRTGVDNYLANAA